MKQKINALIATLKEQREQCMVLIHDLESDLTLSEKEEEIATLVLTSIDSDLEYLLDNLYDPDRTLNPLKSVWGEERVKDEEYALRSVLREMVQPNH